jgi:pyridinium-3,5-bisthiocarboxylic acid mononucleotide nickel chelatase
MTVLWVDASAGASGDMLLGALLGAGVPLPVIQQAVDAVAPEPVALSMETVARGGFAAVRCHVGIEDSVHHRRWRDIRALLLGAPLDHDVQTLALAVFERLAVAEATVHGHDPDDVSFHEVGALDAIADVVGVCAGLVHLGASAVVVSPVAVGSGTVRGAHGPLPVPPPAVAQLLLGVPSLAGPASFESCTPTGAALLTTVATGWGPQPPMTVTMIGVGAGGKDPSSHANVLRVLVADAVLEAPAIEANVVLEANVDDLDPRVWPHVLEELLRAGAVDAWLSPIQMKKGRPAYTLHALTPPQQAAAVRAAVFAQTSTIGVREHEVAKHMLPRELVAVAVQGQRIAVKVARHQGRVVSATPEWDDVAAAAAALGRPPADVLAAAIAAADHLR